MASSSRAVVRTVAASRNLAIGAAAAVATGLIAWRMLVARRRRARARLPGLIFTGTGCSSGLPLVPGSPGAVPTLNEAKRIGGDVGYPLLVKAASGGGGRGMKVAETADDLAEAFSSARAARRNFPEKSP